MPRWTDGVVTGLINGDDYDFCCYCDELSQLVLSFPLCDCARFSGGDAVERMFNRVSRGGESG